MKKIILGILSITTIFACSSLKNFDVEDKDYVLESIEYTRDTKINTIGKGMTIEFESKKISGKSLVNNFFGGYRIDKNKLVVDGLGVTRMAGSPEEMKLESEYLNALSSNKNIVKEGERLILEAQNGMKLVYIKEVDEDKLENKTFKLINPEFKEADITINFQDESIAGKSGVNNYFTTYEIEDNVLLLQTIGSTLMAGDPKLMDLEFKYLGLLNNAIGIKYENKILTLYTKDNQTLVFEEVK
ncbi:META domain-containing protein [Streptobacillus canis]|uniref:META domain-containing protein n=1 Tax=Streptobacillus canis TaxID=2678686 RepID=UPI0012E1C13B|nr:META domain-containing protein [Streptobacillus canis]